jgi:hypothetical protein
MALPPKTASTTQMITISQYGILVMLIPPLRFASQAHDVRSNGAGAAHATYNFLSKLGSHLKDRTSPVGTLVIILPDTVTVHMAWFH